VSTPTKSLPSPGGDRRSTPFSVTHVAWVGVALTGLFVYAAIAALLDPGRPSSLGVSGAATLAARPETSDASAPVAAKSGASGGGRGGPVEPADRVFDARLAPRLAKLDVRSDRAIFALLESLHAASAASARADVERVFGAAVRLARHEDPTIRAAAIAVLGRVPQFNPSSDPFEPALSDVDPRVRREAVVGRTLQGLSKRWHGLLSLATDDDARVRAAVAQAMGAVSDPQARATLEQLFCDRDDDVVDAAAAALGGKITDAPPEVVLDAAKSERARVRCAAARVLGDARTPECLAPLARLVDDPTWTVRAQAIRGLAAFVGPSAATACAKLQTVADDSNLPRTERFEALQALARTETTPDRDVLLSVATTDADPALRLAAARTLLAWADPRSCGALAALLETDLGAHCDDEDRQFVRATALATLQDAAGPKLKERAPQTSDDAAGWRKLLPELEERVRAPDFEFAPAHLAERW